MADDAALPFRVLRRGLKAANRAGASVVERVLRNDHDPGPAQVRDAAPRRNAEAGPVEV